MQTRSSNLNLTIQLPQVSRPSDKTAGWLLTALLVAPAIAGITVPSINQWADARLHTKGVSITTPEVKVLGKVMVPSKTLFYWSPPFAGGEVPTGVSTGGTGLSEVTAAVGMEIAGFPVTSNFGPRSAPCPGCSSFHKGVDVGTPVGVPLKAFVANTKVTCWWDGGGGGQVASIWIGPEFYQALHLSDCRNGTYGPGETYARTGNTGRGTGAHLHWEQKIGGEKVAPKVGVLEATLKGQAPPGFNPSAYLGGSGGVNKDLAGFVGKWEGFRPCPYLDPVGVATIGYGTTRYPDGSPVKMGQACIDEAKAKELKAGDLAIFNKMAKEAVVKPMTPSQETAITSFLYNVGPAGTKSTAIERFNRGDTAGAAEALKDWNKGKVGGQMKVLPGLVNRRAEEAELLKQ